MPLPRFIHDITFDCLRLPSDDDERRFQLYLQLKHEIFYDYRTPLSYRRSYANGRQWLKTYPAWKLVRGADLHDGRLMLELCIRRIANCEVDRAATTFCPREFNSVLHDLIALPGHTTPYHIFNHTSFVKTRALAIMLWKEFKIQTSILQPWGDDPPASEHAILNSPLFRYIAIYADACAQADFLPPIVIRVACWMSTFQARYGLDARKMPMFTEHAYLPSLWKAYDDYVLRQTAEELKRLAKVSKAPNMYQCAADGCGIQAINRSALRKCGGECREEVKPYYCSRECQRKHWFIHRYSCQRSARHASPIVEDDGDPAWIDVETYEPHYDDDTLAEDALHASKEGLEIFIDIPNVSPYRKGEVMRIRTKTLSAAFLRSYRTKWELPTQARRLCWDQFGYESILGLPWG